MEKQPPNRSNLLAISICDTQIIYNHKRGEVTPMGETMNQQETTPRVSPPRAPQFID